MAAKYIKLFNSFTPSFFIPLSNASAEHSQKVMKRLYENFQNSGIEEYEKEELKKLIEGESVGLNKSYTVDGLMESMERGEWFFKDYTTRSLRFVYLVKEELFNFYEALINIHERETDSDPYLLIPETCNKIFNENSYDAINSLRGMIRDDQKKVRKIRVKINKEIRELQLATTNLEALRRCISDDFMNIYKKEISALFSLKTNITKYISYFKDRLDTSNEDSEEQIIKLSENAFERLPVKTHEEAYEYVYDELCELQEMLEKSAFYRKQVDNRLDEMTDIAKGRYDAFNRLNSTKIDINHELIFENIDKADGDDCFVPLIRNKTLNPAELGKFPPIEKEEVVAEKIENAENVIKMTAYERAQKLTEKKTLELIKEKGYLKLSDIPIENIDDFVFFLNVEKIAREKQTQITNSFSNKYLSSPDRSL